MMGGTSNSREHHWWPVGLQRYWADENGDVSWIDYDGTTHKKRAQNRKIAKQSYGHTMLRNSAWETNFEGEFDIDSHVHQIVENIRALNPLITQPSSVSSYSPTFCRLDEGMHRNILLMLISLLVRSPANRFRYEQFPKIAGFPVSENTGKGNMRQQYLTAKRLCETGLISNQYFVFMHSAGEKFLFGDGIFDRITSGLMVFRISGMALVPLTPDTCVYFCTSRLMSANVNCASISAAPWMVRRVNDIVQIYSRKQIFFLGEAPLLNERFLREQFLEHEQRTDRLIAMLDDIAGYNRWV